VVCFARLEPPPTLPSVCTDRHPPQEFNFILPFTPMFGSNAMWLESAPGKGDFAPLTLRRGALVAFHGNTWRHFNKRNWSGQSRVSWDFRVIPQSQFVPQGNVTSLHSSRTFSAEAGGYYTSVCL